MRKNKYFGKVIALFSVMLMILTLGVDCVDATISQILVDEINGYKFEMIENGTLEITEYFGEATSLVLPELYQGYLVTAVGDSAFANNETIESLVIPKNIQVIGIRAFSYLKQLKTVEIYGVKEWKTIEDKGYYNWNAAFMGCDYLNSVVLGDGISSLGYMTFYHCESLKEIHIPATVGEIDTAAIGYNIYTPGGEPDVMKDTNFKIYGYSHSAAEEYSQLQGMVFISIGDMIEEYMLDVNYDSCVNAKDALIVLKHAAKICELDYNQNKISDANEDGIINSLDVLEILKKAADII